MLLELDDGTNEVFYAAPRFHELARSIRHGVPKKSQLVNLRQARAVGVLDAASHHVAYDAIGRIFVPIKTAGIRNAADLAKS